MGIFNIPTSKDIYIEIDGNRIAVAQNYKTQARRKSRAIEAFGSDEPVAVIGGRTNYLIELTRVDTSLSQGDNVNFYNLRNFNLVIVKTDSRIVYSGCEWSDIGEAGELGAPVLEKVKLIATKRTVI